MTYEAELEAEVAPLLARGLDGGNPYLDAFTTLTGGRELVDIFDPAEFHLVRHRFALVHHYAWAVPTDDALDAVGATGEVVEVGAGGGYWAALLRARGVVVHACDSDPDPDTNHYLGRSWTEVERGTIAWAGRHPDATLFLCWPVMSDGAARCLQRYLRAGGKRIAYVGEDRGGCCADDSFFDALRRETRRTAEVAIPQFPGIHDYLSVWEAR